MHPAINQMVSPSKRRKGIWREGVLQIHITRACDLSCFHCTQGSNLGGKPVMMSLENFEQACASLKGYFGVVGIFGGNPVMHPQFAEICKIMRKYIPYEQRGLWCNHPRGKGDVCRITFNPAYSNLNVHLSREAHDEFCSSWPEAKRFVKGLDPSWPEAKGKSPEIVGDSRHGPPFVALKDVIADEEERWNLIKNCDVNKYWSSMLCQVKGQLRAFFCELAGAQAMLHENDEGYPDTGMPVTVGWWTRPIQDFQNQINKHCHECGIPLKGYGQLAVGGDHEQVSETHRGIYKPKVRDRLVQLVTSRDQLGGQLPKATDYIQNGGLQ